MVYHAIFNNGRSRVHQHLLLFDKVILPKSVSWWMIYRSIVQQLVDSDVDFAIRFNLDENHFKRILFLIASQERESQAEKLRATFVQLNSIYGNTIGEPKDRANHDRIVTNIPPFRAKIGLRFISYGDHDIRLGYEFRLYSEIDDLFAMALTRGWMLNYQLNIRRWKPTEEEIKWSRRNLLRVESEDGLPETIKLIQRHVFYRIEDRPFIIDEFIAASDRTVCGEISQFIHKRFAQSIAGSGLPAEPLLIAEQDGCFKNVLSTGFHSSSCENVEPWHEIAAAASAEEVKSILTWGPPKCCASLVSNTVPIVESDRERIGVQQHFWSITMGDIVHGDKHQGSNIIAGAVGSGASNTGAMQTNNYGVAQQSAAGDAVLAGELLKLAETMREQASSPLQEVATEHVIKAAEAAQKGSGEHALAYLKAAGSWALSVAEKIGVEAAKSAISKAIGMP